MTRFEKFWDIYIREKIWLENNLSQLAQVIFEQQQINPFWQQQNTHIITNPNTEYVIDLGL
jgi:hypothetical protein